MLHGLQHRLAGDGHSEYSAAAPGTGKPHDGRPDVPEGTQGRPDPDRPGRCSLRVPHLCDLVVRELQTRQGRQKGAPEEAGGDVPCSGTGRKGHPGRLETARPAARRRENQT